MNATRISRSILRARYQTPAQCLRRIAPVRHASTNEPNSATTTAPTVPWKTPHSITAWPPEPLLPPPKEGELLMERLPNRELPPIPPLIPTHVRNTFPIFVLIMTASMLAFFNYQKQESSVVSSTMYALRTDSEVREVLGDEIYFASKYPWIKGEINQVHGKIDVRFWVKGTKRQGEVRLRCRRRGVDGRYFTQEYSLTLEDGTVMQLYDPNGNAIDPFMGPGELYE